jgi:carbonic anhydrase/acetyltransferase-like protein (isoleucine patch superfamily)
LKPDDLLSRRYRPEIAASAWVAPDANLIGKIVVEDEASIWFGATLRGDNEEIRVGRGSNVQENCVLHTDMGFPLVIGRLHHRAQGYAAWLHHRRRQSDRHGGDGPERRAKIGKGCLIGAGALITEGKEIPDGSLVMGAPGKVVRQLDEAGLARLRASAAGYRANARRFAAGLRAI